MAKSQQRLRVETSLDRTYNELGNAFHDLGNLCEALACYQQALDVDPNSAETRNNVGVALAGQNKLDEARASYQEALRLKPDYADAHYNLGLLWINQGEWEQAVRELQQAMRFQPDNAEAHYQLGYALSEQAKPMEAERCFQQAARLKPDHAEAHWAVAYNRLIRGNFEQAWLEYQSLWRLQRFWPDGLQPPFWDGSPLAGRTILLWAEQGYGDTVQFIRYASVVKRSGGTVLVECPESLHPLLGSCPAIDRLVAGGSERPAFDVHASLLKLPCILKTSLSTVPAAVPYLAADAKLRNTWQGRLRRYLGFKIGIAWQGNPHYQRDRQRSIPLVHFAPLGRIEGVSLFSLQKGTGNEQLRAASDKFRVIDLGSRLDEKSGAFMDTAAVMCNLDLVITSDTAIAHLAGALGVPVWLALSFAPDWRWLLEREDSPWYPTMRLFRQTKPGDWNGVFARMAEELSRKVVARPRQSRHASRTRQRGF